MQLVIRCSREKQNATGAARLHGAPALGLEKGAGPGGRNNPTKMGVMVKSFGKIGLVSWGIGIVHEAWSHPTMKSTFQCAAAAGALCLGLAAAAAAGAQDRPAAPGATERQKMFEDMQDRREQRLHDLLQIKPDQEAAFRTFVSSMEQMRPQHERGMRGEGAGGVGPGAEPKVLTAPERMDRMAQRLTEAQQRLQKASAAVKTFYAVLTPDQRKAFDVMSPMMGKRMRSFGPMMRGGPEGAPPR